MLQPHIATCLLLLQARGAAVREAEQQQNSNIKNRHTYFCAAFRLLCLCPA